MPCQKVAPTGVTPGADHTAAYYFHQGTNFTAYDYMGVHAEPTAAGWRYTFRVWAYRACCVEVTGDFNGWGSLPMTRITEMGVWEAVLESAEPLTGCRYKYRVSSDAGIYLKADPYARMGEWGEKTASISL